jgi:hypothetical protein
MSCVKPLEFLVQEVELQSSSPSENDLLFALTNILEIGATTNSLTLCCQCSDSSIFPYFIGGIEIYLKYAEGVGFIMVGETFVISGTKTTGPIPAGSYCKIIDYVNGDDFSGYVDTNEPTNGVVNTDNFEFYCNKDLYWYNGSKVLFAYEEVFACYSGCCLNILTKGERFLQLYEGFQDGLDCQKFECCEFRNEIDILLSSVSSESVQELVDIGILEIGDTGFGALNSFFEDKSENFKLEFLKILLDKGLTVVCNEEVVGIFGVETYLKYAEAVGLTQSAAVP